MWALWWVWMAGAVGLAILEIVAPGFVFLGFAVGAAITGMLLVLGVVLSGPVLALVFAVVSLLAWLAMRKLFGSRTGQVRKWHRDINDD